MPNQRSKKQLKSQLDSKHFSIKLRAKISTSQPVRTRSHPPNQSIKTRNMRQHLLEVTLKELREKRNQVQSRKRIRNFTGRSLKRHIMNVRRLHRIKYVGSATVHHTRQIRLIGHHHLPVLKINGLNRDRRTTLSQILKTRICTSSLVERTYIVNGKYLNGNRIPGWQKEQLLGF